MLDLLGARPMTDLDEAEARLVRALRLWAAACHAGRRPLEAASERLGSLRAAAHLHLLLEELAGVWPEPFAVSPPCCARLSHDEATLVEMARLGRRGDRRGFDRLLAEMLGDEARERLYLSAAVLRAAL